MSGTSLDGVDGVLVDLRRRGPPMQVLAHAHRAFDAALRAELLALNTPGDNELHRAALAANARGALLCRGGARAAAAARRAAADVRAIGAHGQTVRHRPGEFDGTGYTVQLLNGALLAELTGIDVVCRLPQPRRGRRRPGRAAGAGLPRRGVRARRRTTSRVLNLGGIANLTRAGAPTARVARLRLRPGQLPDGLLVPAPSGPAVRRRRRAGPTAARSTRALLSALLAEPYFARPPPKSTGRDLFNPAWLRARAGRGMPTGAGRRAGDAAAN